MSTYSKKKFKTKVRIEIPKPYICKICEKELKSIPGLASHLKNQHDRYPYGDYLLKYYNIDVDVINKEWENGREDRKQDQLKGLRERAKYLKGKPLRERMTPEEYNGFREKMKGVFTLKWFIERYGEEEGKKKYEERSISLSKNTYWHKYNRKNNQNWSNISQELFWDLYAIIKDDYKKIYFGELNHEFSCGVPYHNFDFVVNDINKVIEFNGDKFHANPKKYLQDDHPIPFLKESSKEIWDKDRRKLKKLKDKGYDVLIIWESEYLSNRKDVIIKCLNFLK